MKSKEISQYARKKLEEKYKVKISENTVSLAEQYARAILQKIDARKHVHSEKAPKRSSSLESDIKFASKCISDYMPILKSKGLC